MNLYGIPLGTPFLPALARGALARLGTGEELARATILLPTQRSARALRVAFLEAADAPALLLPRMRALAGLSTEEADELSLPALLDLPPAVDAMTRQAALAALVARHRPAHGGKTEPLPAAQAWNLAGELAKLLDEVALEEREEMPDDPVAYADLWLARLDRLAPDDLAEHWRITTGFLRAVAEGWQTWLRERELLDIGLRRVLALRVQRREWEARPPNGAVIAAGIGAGGTIPAAAELLRLIARGLPDGAVVLPHEDAASAAIPDEVMATACTHPFAGHRRLLRQLGAARGDIRPWTGTEGLDASPRAELLGTALLPHQALAPWTRQQPGGWSAALDGLFVMHAPDAQAEAAGIALAMRGCLEASAPPMHARGDVAHARGRTGPKVALVTPDRELACRVAAELPRHGLVADDSAGRPLDGVPAGAFLRLLAECVAAEFAPVPLLSLLKHPLCCAGMDRLAWSRAVRALELAALRGPRPAAGLAGIRARFRAGAFGPDLLGPDLLGPDLFGPDLLGPDLLGPDLLGPDSVSPDSGRAHSRRAHSRHPDSRRETLAAEALAALEARLGGFARLAPGDLRPPQDVLQLHLAAAEALCATPDLPGGLRLYANEEGEPLARHLHAMTMGFEHLPPIAAREYPALFAAALACGTARCPRVTRGRDAPAHPQVEILGLLEARLLDFDCVILGALDETVWPLAADPGPWMSRPMRDQFGLPEPEMRIGRVAADFALAACSARTTILTRAARRGGSPTVPARWLTRLDTYLRGQAGGGQAGGGQAGGAKLAESHAAAWAAGLDAPPGEAKPAARPAPAPPAALRPRRLTVTDFGTLMGDPYAFYARRVLRLAPLDALDADPGAAEYGQLVHGAMRRFLDALPPGAWPGDAAAGALWARAAADALAEERPSPALAAIWRARLARIGAFVREVEAPMRAQFRRTLGEAKGRMVLHRPLGDIELEGRADRLDVLAGGRLRLVDYKTGAPPTREQVRDGTAPQLPVEAWMAEHGAFDGVPTAPVDSLQYWRLGGGQPPGEITDLGSGPKALDIGGAMAGARRALEDFADHFLLGARPFVARPHPRRQPRSDYDHLARHDEWAAASGDAP